ncbi:MAG TPA: hypothetical protein VGM70_10945 [Pseudolysinimonas sp.]
MTNTLPAAPSLAEERRERFRPFLVLLACFIGLSLATELFLAGLAVAGIPVDIAVWIRCSLVFASSIVLFLITRSAAGGSVASLTRVRIISVVVVVAVIVIISIPGFLPDWVRIEQGACGGLVVPVAILVNMSRTRALFPKDPPTAASAA